MSTRFKQNRLAEATSLYLLQHKTNPVHWQPWEAEVFAEARRRNVPVLLSVGYAACHWCHVMAHESFEDDEVAALMNAHFVCIKLDREERPDLDEIYMSALHMMGEQGGWPLTMCLDADAKPFWGGTYFPKMPQYGRPGFMQILQEISRIWHEEPDKIRKNTSAVTEALTAQAQADARAALPDELMHRAAQTLNGHMDLDKGGLSGAPKFPQPFLYRFLFQHAQLTQDDAMRGNVVFALNRMCQGGLYDHLGGGFARYSVDADWLVPHFEKMLYDNALLLELMVLVWRDTRDPLLAARINETVSFLLRDMRLDTGAFAASLDADTQGEEGKFYVWSKAEAEAVLRAAGLGDQAAAFCAAYDLTESGNFEGHNIPHLLYFDGPQNDHFAAARAALFHARARRVAPDLDDKILADWNGMAIAALADAAMVFAREDWRDAACAAYHASKSALGRDDGSLCHSARAARQLDISLAADYAFMGQAALALYSATSQSAYLEDARDFAARLHDTFHDTQRGAYLSNARQGDATLLVNQRPRQDNAVPSANAAIMAFFTTLSIATGEAVHHARAADIITALGGHLSKAYPSMTALLAAQHAHLHVVSIIIVGTGSAARALYHAARRHKIFAAFVLQLDDTSALDPTHPAAGKTAPQGTPAAYICPGQSCLAPVFDDDALTAQLDALLLARNTLPQA